MFCWVGFSCCQRFTAVHTRFAFSLHHQRVRLSTTQRLLAPQRSLDSNTHCAPPALGITYVRWFMSHLPPRAAKARLQHVEDAGSIRTSRSGSVRSSCLRQGDCSKCFWSLREATYVITGSISPVSSAYHHTPTFHTPQKHASRSSRLSDYYHTHCLPSAEVCLVVDHPHRNCTSEPPV